MDFIRKAEEAITGKKTESPESTQSSNHGPHSSNLVNKLDPRVDSDRDNRADHSGINDQHLGTSRNYGTGTGAGTTATTATGTTATGTSSTTTGPHKSNLLNKLDPRVDSDATTSHAVPSSVTHGTEPGITGAGTTHTGTHAGTHNTNNPLTGATGTTKGSSSTNAGPHSSNIANKADPRVDSDRDHRARHETVTGAGTGTSTNAGPHDSNVANKADPRIDSDRDNRARHEPLGSHGIGSTTHGTTHTTSTNAGPHDSNIANKLDPRVDSDRDNRARHETHGTGIGAGHGTTHGVSNTGASSNVGPHDSNATNKLDPRIDSDRDNRALLSGAGTAPGLASTHGPTSNLHGTGTSTGHAQPLTGTGTTHGTSTSTNAGPHDSNIANKLDPRVDSDRDNRAAHHSLPGTGPGTVNHGTHTRAPGSLDQGLAGSSYNTPTGTAGRTSGTTATAGPHDSSIANKLDPRVESDVTGTQRTI